MKKILITFFLIILIGGIAFYVFFSGRQTTVSEKEREAAMAKLLGHTPVLSSNPKQNTWGVHEDHYLKLTYPEIARIYSDTSASVSAGRGEVFEFEQEDPRYFFTIQVIPANNARNYDDVPGVRLRRLEKDIYTEKPLTISGIHSLLFEKASQDQLERSAFVLTNGNIYSFSLTGVNPKILVVFDRVIGSVKIK